MGGEGQLSAALQFWPWALTKDYGQKGQGSWGCSLCKAESASACQVLFGFRPGFAYLCPANTLSQEEAQS